MYFRALKIIYLKKIEPFNKSELFFLSKAKAQYVTLMVKLIVAKTIKS